MNGVQKFYVYKWYNIDTGYVFYVGKGNNNRYKNIKGRNMLFEEYYKSNNCDVSIVKDNLNEQSAFENEIKIIKKYREIGQCCCNICDGGQGGVGAKRTEGQKRNLRFYALINAFNKKTPFKIRSYGKQAINVLIYGEDMCVKGNCEMPKDDDYDFLDEYDRMVDEMQDNDLTFGGLLDDMILSGFYED